ncbi:MAG: diacylglycerol kinase family lipid kinase [Rhizobiales bacterium]|jgi:diacylglycerol kinase (ATP)|nr:diacylglycerol kinase family lipid kinase [Hyphomicrobiales bacterium]
MKTFVVVNPAAAGGRAGKHWPRISRELKSAIGDFDSALTKRPGEASALVRNAIANGAKTVIAVGGDGTINEAVNGLSNTDALPPGDVSFGFVMYGTGGDFRRSLDFPKGVSAAIERLKSGRTQVIDLGRLSYTAPNGTKAQRWFNNISSFGFSGEVVRAVNAARFSKLLGGKFSFFWNSFIELRKYQGCKVDITIDGKTISENVCTAAICNGRFFGGGMMMAPDAVLDDGNFDVVVVRQDPPLTIFDMRLLYSGAHLKHPNVSVHRGRKVEARPLSNAPIYLDVEGEAPGSLPATFEVVPRALRVLC